MKKIIMTLAAVALLFAGCQKDDDPIVKTYKSYIYAVGDNSKTELASGGAVHWMDNDAIWGYRGNGTMVKYEMSTHSGSNATFGTDETVPDGGLYFAIYPWVNGEDAPTIHDGIMSGFEAVRHNQVLKPGSFGPNSNVSVGISESSQIPFSNLGGLVKVIVMGATPVKSIKIEALGVSPQVLSGQAKIDLMNFNLATPTFSWADEGTYSEVVATAPTNEGIDISNGQYFYLALPPCQLDEWRLVLTDISNTEYVTIPDYTLVVTRAHVTTIEGMLASPNRKIFYTADQEIPQPDIPGHSRESHGFANGQGYWEYNHFVTAIPNDFLYAADPANNLQSITLPDCCRSIGNRAFRGQQNLTSITMPGVTMIGEYAFYDCTQLSSISLSNVTTIGEYAFYDCTRLSSISLPNVTQIGEYAFFGCLQLTSVSIPLVTEIEASTFADCLSLTSVNMPNVNVIKKHAFDKCNFSNGIDLSNVTLIGAGAFSSCQLTSVSLPSITHIDDEAFELNPSIENVTIGPSCLRIGKLAFGNSNSIARVDCYARSAPIISTGEDQESFPRSSSCVLHVLNDLTSDEQLDYMEWLDAEVFSNLITDLTNNAKK